MGTFILPGRLKDELQGMEQALLEGTPLDPASPHAPWLEEIRPGLPRAADRESIRQFLREKVGEVCFHVLTDTGVYPLNDEGKAGLLCFLHALGAGEAGA